MVGAVAGAFGIFVLTLFGSSTGRPAASVMITGFVARVNTTGSPDTGFVMTTRDAEDVTVDTAVDDTTDTALDVLVGAEVGTIVDSTDVLGSTGVDATLVVGNFDSEAADGAASGAE
jgi:hypothetical protein